MTALRLASLRPELGDTEGALAALDVAARPLGTSDYAINVQINRAAFLTKAGRWAEALTEIERAQALFDKATSKSDGERVPGSDR